MGQLSNHSINIQKILSGFGLHSSVIELPNSTRTAQEAAKRIGCEQSQIVKSLIFITKKSLTPVLILASGSNMLNEKIIAKYSGEDILKADAAQVKQITGFTIGGIPPLGHKAPIKHIFFDEDLLKYDNVWAAAGTPNSVFNISSKDLVTVTKAIVIAVN